MTTEILPVWFAAPSLRPEALHLAGAGQCVE